MSKAGLRLVLKSKLEVLGSMANAKDFFAPWANRRFMALYANAQRTRWQTEGSSEGVKWRKLDPLYYTRKKRIYGAYPGAGEVVLIATSRLLAGILPPDERVQEKAFGEEFRKIVTNRRITIATTTPYAEYVDEDREFNDWSPITKRRFADDFKVYLSQGVKRGAST